MAKKKSPIKFVLVGVAVIIITGILISTLFEETVVDLTELIDFVNADPDLEISEEEPVPPFEFGIPIDPFEDPEVIIIVEDPVTGEPIIIIDQEIIDELDMIENGTSMMSVPEVLPPEFEPEPEDVFMLTDLSLIANISKIDSDGNLTFETTETLFPLLSFFVEDISNIDFSDGRFEARLLIKTDPNIPVKGSGTFDVLINNQTINMNPITISFDGISDENGMISIDFVNPSGLKSDFFLVNVAQQIDKIAIRGITPLEFKVIDMSVTIMDVDYSITDATVFSFDFFRDQNLILIMNEAGEEIRAFPTDDRLQVGTTSGTWSYLSCNRHNRAQCIGTRTISGSLGILTMDSVSVKDSLGNIILQNNIAGTGWRIDDFITRNDTYTVNYGRIHGGSYANLQLSMTGGSFTFSVPEEQVASKYYCVPVISSKSIGSGFCPQCTTPDSSTLRIACNFP